MQANTPKQAAGYGEEDPNLERKKEDEKVAS